MYLAGIVMSLTLIVGGCASGRVPIQTSLIVDQLRCEMEIADIENLSGTKLSEEGQRPWGTHILHLGTTDVWLQFNDEKLRSVQVATLAGLLKMKLWPRTELCAPIDQLD